MRAPLTALCFVWMAASATGCSSADPTDTTADAAEDVDDTLVIDAATDTHEEGDTVDPDSTLADSGADTLADSASVDTATDTSAADTSVADTFAFDTFVPDTSVVDTFALDTFALDTFALDTFVPDTFVPDTSVADTFLPDTFVPDTGTLSCAIPPSAGGGGGGGGGKWYTTISTANVYVSGASGALRGCFIEFTPAYALWTDGERKRRWIYLPAGTKIETGPNPIGDTAPNMDRWVFPVGTRFLKEFARADGKKLETRIWERTSSGYLYGSFRWRADQTDADYTESGGPAALLLDDGVTTHDIPSKADCGKCHDGEPGKGLGFSAVQLSKAPLSTDDLTLVRIIARGWLSHPPTSIPDTTLGSPVPGTTVEAKGMGYLHANCGHCHNQLGQAKGPGMWLRIRYGETNVKTTELWTTTVGIGSGTWSKYGASLRINPGTSALGDGVPSLSSVYLRPTFRGSNDQMPPLGTALVDTLGLKDLEAWIKAL